MWTNIQGDLFPSMEKTHGKLSTEYKKLIAVLELVRVESFIDSSMYFPGRPTKDRIAIARAFIAKIILKITYTKQLVERLNRDEQLRAICGWSSFSFIPSEATFSRAFDAFAKSSLPEKVHTSLIKNLYKDQLVGHVIKDSTPIDVREKHLKKRGAKTGKKLKAEKLKKKRAGELNRRQKQLQENDLDKMINDLPSVCDKGIKKSSLGCAEIWKGYKLHAAVDDNCIPLAVIITSASLNDCEVAIPLAAKANRVTTNLYDLMDAAYDHPEIKMHSISLGHVPIIDKCPCSYAQKIEKEAEKERKNLLNFKTAEDVRYKKRLPGERINALYKDYYGGRNLFYRGHSKVSCHVMFGILAATAVTVLNLTI